MPPAPFELEQLTLRLLRSQHEYIFSPASYTALDGGWGSGKTQALCIKALVLSYAYPNNMGVIGRFNATDLVDTTMTSFFEVCPRSWIKSFNKQRKWVTLRNGSVIVFRHLNDPNPKRSHIAGMNLGWFAIDQAEECGLEHWNALMGRLRRPQAPKRFGFLAANPNGKDWVYDLFFSSPATHKIGDFSAGYKHGALLGIAVKSEENKKSNGGFVDDSYFDGLRQNMPPEWVARFLDCSFEDFSGKIYKSYTVDSVHNIEPFEIPSHWGTVVGIDVGGDVPWGIPVGRIDEVGNIVWTNEFYEASVNVTTVSTWIKQYTPKWNDPNNLYIIDHENKLAMLELAEAGIHCRPAQKKVNPGIIRVGGYLHVNPTLTLPPWYHESQPKTRLDRFLPKGAPRMYFFRTLINTRKEFDTYHWDENKLTKPVKKNDHLCDAIRYVTMARPLASQLKPVDHKREALRRHDAGTAAMWDAYDKRMAVRAQRRNAQHLLSTEIFQENDKPEKSGRDAETEILEPQGGGFDWNEA